MCIGTKLRLFKVTSFCCFDLRTGGFIIGYFQLLFSIAGLILLVNYLFPSFNSAITIRDAFAILLIIIPVFTSIYFLYGLHMKKTGYMVVDIIVFAVSTWIGILVLFGFSISRLANVKFHKTASYDSRREVEWETGDYIMLCCGLMLSIVCCFYFTEVKYALYKAMKTEQRGIEVTKANVERPNRGIRFSV